MVNLSNYNFFKFEWRQLLIVLIFLGWFFSYMLAEQCVQLIYPIINKDITKDSVENLKIILNFFMAITVLCITLKDRYQAIERLSKNQKPSIVDDPSATPDAHKEESSDEEFKKEIDKQLIPFIISLVPFSSAAMDLGLKFNAPLITLFYIIVTFVIINVLDIKYLFKFSESLKPPIVIVANFIVYGLLSFLLAGLFLLT